MTVRLIEEPLQMAPQLADSATRARALDPTRSFLVQAPAGSGKTELLARRFLKLLSVVDEPEQVLAITFARGATAEMRSRVIEKLKKASLVVPEPGAGTDEELQMAVDALRRSQERKWNLLEQPQRLNIQTIDSLCLSIAHRTPLLARLGGTLQPTENAAPLYDLAAQRTLQQLGGEDARLNAALSSFLMLRDNNLKNCEELLSAMLKQRDQWAHLFLGGDDVDLEALRARLEQPFRREIEKALARVHALFSNDTSIAAELTHLLRYACGNVGAEHPLRKLEGLQQIPGSAVEFAADWECLAGFLLTKGEGWRKSFDIKQGFRPGVREKTQIKALVGRLQNVPGLLETLNAVCALPPLRYSEAQWQTLLDIFTILRRGVAELKVVFAEQNTVDFAEVGLAAEMVLGPHPDEVALGTEQQLALSDRIRHLLVDEFQDTSRRQHQLLTSLLRGWDNCDGRTCFIVGDPMQSIYLFRQAEVELFNQVSRHGLSCDGVAVELENLTLKTNFRSHAGLVEPLNEFFDRVFGQDAEASVGFTGSVAKHPAPAVPAFYTHALILPPSATQDDKHAARRLETEEVVAAVKKHWPEVEKARQTPDARFTIGILVRAKKHAAAIAAALRSAGLAFRAVDLETLGERQEILDLVALTRALSHPMDRVAWLAVLRAPWCGLELRDLHALCGTDVRGSNPAVIELLQVRVDKLTPDGQRRAGAAAAVLQRALQFRHSAETSFASIVERTWYGLGGHLCVGPTAFENVQTYFAMLDQLESAGNLLSRQEIDKQLSRLFAQPDPESSDRAGVQIMTIHKAKGLGFDVVIVPGLERGTVNDRQSLLCLLERSSQHMDGPHPENEILVAPIGEKGPASGLYRWVQEQRNQRHAEERKRLLYVACTRAAKELHLFGTATKKGSAGSELKPGDSSSLLATAWPALGEEFQKRAAQDSSLALLQPQLQTSQGDHGDELDIAASATAAGLRMFRLPLGAASRDFRNDIASVIPISLREEEETNNAAELSSRPEGSHASRAFGTAVHTLFERAASLIEHGTTVSELRAALPRWKNHARAVLRHNGVTASGGNSNRTDESLADRAVEALRAALDDPKGLWILGSRPGARSETAWTGWLDGALRTLRVDRIFLAGDEPLSSGEDCLWIVDYKTAQNSGRDRDAFLVEEKAKYQQQLEMYGRMLRLVRGGRIELRLALYYPLMQRLEHWPM